MRVLFWADGFWPSVGGMETQALQFIEKMQKKGHQYIVLAQRDSPDLKEDEVYRGIRIKRFAFDRIIAKCEIQQIHAIRETLEKISREFQPDLVHLSVWIGCSAFAFLLFKSLFPIPIIFTCHTPFTYENPSTLMIEKLASSTQQICCVSKWVMREIEQSVPAARNQLRLIYNGLSMPEIDPLPLPFSPPTLLLLGRLTPEKGFRIAITAFSLLKKMGSCAQLLVAGEGIDRLFLENLVHQLGLTHSVQFTGEVARNQIPSLMNQTTLVIIPSYFESFGLVALEAMQMQRPVIASAVGGLQEIVSDGETGLLVPPGNPALLYAAIHAMLSDPQKAIQMGKAGQEKAMAFTLDQHVASYEEVYSLDFRGKLK